jgi:hypothetical protein
MQVFLPDEMNYYTLTTSEHDTMIFRSQIIDTKPHNRNFESHDDFNREQHEPHYNCTNCNQHETHYSINAKQSIKLNLMLGRARGRYVVSNNLAKVNDSQNY